jgi:metal-responsive CopG/Arc/MetJ family transcriptional regulator
MGQGERVVSVGVAMPRSLALRARIAAARQDKSRSSLITEILEAALQDLEAGKDREKEQLDATGEDG